MCSFLGPILSTSSNPRDTVANIGDEMNGRSEGAIQDWKFMLGSGLPDKQL